MPLKMLFLHFNEILVFLFWKQQTFILLFPTSFELIDCKCLLPSGTFLNLGKAHCSFFTLQDFAEEDPEWPDLSTADALLCPALIFSLLASICSLSFLTGAPAAMLSSVTSPFTWAPEIWLKVPVRIAALPTGWLPCLVRKSPQRAWQPLPDTGSMEMSF